MTIRPLRPIRPSPYGLEIRDAYNAHLRRLRAQREMARLAVTMAGGLLTFALGAMMCQAGSLLFTSLAMGVIITGLWGAQYLLTHH